MSKLVERVVIAILVAGVLTLISVAAAMLFPPPDLAGQWHCLMETRSADRQNYVGMLLIYGMQLSGASGELEGQDWKTHDFSRGRDNPWIPRSDRSRGAIGGTLSRRFFNRFGGSQVKLVINETTSDGIQSVRGYEVLVSGEKLVGTFTWDVADQAGFVLCRRDSFDVSDSSTGEKDRLRQLMHEAQASR